MTTKKEWDEWLDKMSRQKPEPYIFNIPEQLKPDFDEALSAYLKVKDVKYKRNRKRQK